MTAGGESLNACRLHGVTTKERWGTGCLGRVHETATECPPRPATVLNPWRLHSPPRPQRCSAVGSPFVPSPLPSLDARRAARVKPELRELRRRRAETPAGNLGSQESLPLSGAQRKGSPPRPSQPRAPVRKPGSSGCVRITKPAETTAPA